MCLCMLWYLSCLKWTEIPGYMAWDLLLFDEISWQLSPHRIILLLFCTFLGLQLPIRETASYCTTTLLNALFFPHFLLCDAVYVISMGLSLNLFIFFFRFVEFTGESTKEFSASHTIQKLFLAFFISYIFHHLLKFPIFSSMLCTFTIVFLTILITINVLVWQFQHETFKFVYFGCLVYYLKHLFLAIVCMSLFLNECWTSCMEQ